jgi:beta-lactam-binding protein with PASTA domain
MPDVTGLGLREAVRALTAAGLSVRPVGSGVVAIQTPAAGTTLERGAVVRLELRRTPTAPTTPAGAGR